MWFYNEVHHSWYLHMNVAMVWTCMAPPDSYVEILILNMMVLGGGALDCA